MATSSLGRLTLDLVARIGGFTGPLEQAQRKTKRSMRDITSHVKTAATAITAASAAAVAAGAGVIAFTNNAAQSARELQNLAAIANTTSEDFQRLAYGANTVGVASDKLSDILKDVNDKVGDFLNTGGGELKDYFEQIAPRIGQTADEFRGLSGPQALQKYYDGLQQANLSQAEMTFYLEAIANDASALAPLLRDGGAEFSRMADEADRLGIVLDGMQIAQLTEFANQFDRITTILTSMGQVIAAELAPYLSVIGDRFVEAAGDAGDFQQIAASSIRSVVEWVGKLLDAWRKYEIINARVKVWTAEMDLAFAEFAQGAWESVAWFIDTFTAGINNLIRGMNAIPGFTDLDMIDSWVGNSGFLNRIREQTDAAKESLWEYSWELHDLVNRPLPSEAIDNYLDDVDAKFTEFREKLASEGGALGLGAGMPALPDTGGKGDKGDEPGKALGLYEGADTGDAVYTYWEQWLEAAQVSLESFDELAGNTIENFSTRFGEAFESMIFDAQSLDEAVQGMAESMARSIVAALGEMAAQWLAYQAVELLVGRTTQASAASMQAANAAAMSQTAGLNAYASTAAIPIVGPALAPGAMAAALAATAPVAASVATTSALGMAHDGIDSVPQTGTWLLEKGERVTTSQTSAKLDRTLDDVRRGQGNTVGSQAPVVNIHEDKSRAGQADSRRDDGQWVIDVWVANALGDGRVHGVMQGKYGLSTQGR